MRATLADWGPSHLNLREVARVELLREHFRLDEEIAGDPESLRLGDIGEERVRAYLARNPRKIPVAA